MDSPTSPSRVALPCRNECQDTRGNLALSHAGARLVRLEGKVRLFDAGERELPHGVALPEEVMGVAFVGTAGMLFHGFVRKHLTLAELEDAVEELSKTIWLAPAVVAEVLKKAREAER